MFLEGLDALDQKIVQLLIENARLSYSDIGEKVGISRVAVKARIQALEAEIASLQDFLNNTEDETERADLQAQIDAKRAEQAQDQAVIDGNAARRARVSELSGNLSTLSTTKVALQNATTLLTARQEAETALNDGMQPLQQTLNDTAAALRDQLLGK